MSIGTVLLAVLFTVLSTAITLAIYYVASGEWLWDKKDKGSGRNWSPPR
jgi:hypothetical protein